MTQLQKRAIIVLVAGIVFNLAIGMLYTWSIIRGQMMLPIYEDGWGWTSSQAGMPFTIAILFFSLGVLIGGRIQDKIGPRVVVTIGGLLVGLGMTLSGLLGNNPIGITVAFGVVTGVGMGLGYGCVMPPALKWFHPGKKGMVSGLIVGGFGFGAVYFGPLASAMLSSFGIGRTFIFMGIGVLIVGVIAAQFIKNPPEGYMPQAPKSIKSGISKAGVGKDYTWREMVKTPRFYMMFIMFIITSSVGLMIIGNVTRVATLQMGITDTAVLAFLVSFMAITNMVGRIIGGFISDRIGHINTLFIIFVLKFANMVGFAFYADFPTLIIGIIGIGLCFGALLSVFPALTAEQYGLKYLGSNYGIVFLAWGLSGVVAPVLADYFYDTTGSFMTAYIICAVMMVLMVGVNFLFKRNIGKLS